MMCNKLHKKLHIATDYMHVDILKEWNTSQII